MIGEHVNSKQVDNTTLTGPSSSCFFCNQDDTITALQEEYGLGFVHGFARKVLNKSDMRDMVQHEKAGMMSVTNVIACVLLYEVTPKKQ